MAWDEKLFGHLYRLFVRQPQAPTGDPLTSRRAELTLLASAIAGRAVTLTTTRGEGASLRVPDALEGGEGAWVYRVAHQAEALRLGLFVPRYDARSDTLASILAAPMVQRSLFAAFPGAREVFERVARRPAGDGLLIEVLEGRLSNAPSTREELEATVVRFAESTQSVFPFELFGPLPRVATSLPMKVTRSGEGASGTERAARNVRALRRIDLPDDRRDENPLTHSFEKVHTAEEYKGGRKTADAGDEMAEHGDALDELSIEEVVRSNVRARSIYRADLGLDAAVVDDHGATPASGTVYDEWDEGKRAYRKHWCRVFERVGLAVDADVAAHEVAMLISRRGKQIRAIAAELARIDRAHVPRPRQPDGSELDLEAIVDRHAALAASAAPPDKLYVSRRRRPPDIDVALLMDASLSTDAWVQNRRVIDVARQSIVVLGAAMEDARIRTMVAAFHSNTRSDCRFVLMKRFDESWPMCARRLLATEPTGYTRIGPALRHATEHLLAANARRRLVVLISDAKPTDTDQYEGRYGVADIRQAVRESRANGVDVVALTIESSSRGDFAKMFGAARYALLRRPDDLSTALGRVFLDLTR